MYACLLFQWCSQCQMMSRHIYYSSAIFTLFERNICSARKLSRDVLILPFRIKYFFVLVSMTLLQNWYLSRRVSKMKTNPVKFKLNLGPIWANYIHKDTFRMKDYYRNGEIVLLYFALINSKWVLTYKCHFSLSSFWKHSRLW